MIIEKEIPNSESLDIKLRCDVTVDTFTGKVCYYYFATIDDGTMKRNIYPELLTSEQKGMAADKYTEDGRCEFFKRIRPSDMLSLIQDKVISDD